VTAEDLEAQRTSTKVFWKAQGHDIAVIKLLRTKAGLPPILPDTSPQPLA
jgi:hypothetical protein